jgi:polysaccharide export outer membrane protein
MNYRSVLEIIFAISVGVSLSAQTPQASPPASGAVATAEAPQVNTEAKKPVAYILGPQDAVLIKLLNADELGTLPYPIDLRGMINVPMAGRIHAAGLTVEQLEGALTERFKEYLQDPVVTVTIAEFHSQRISVLGQVTTPGVHQIQGEKTLFEVISEAGGLKQEAGDVLKITRRMEWGPIPLPGAVSDPSNEFSVAEVSIRSVMEAQNPAQNIQVKPDDVITVPKADLIYVIGAVKKAGGYVLSERVDMSVLQALSMAEGLERTAASGKAMILRGGSTSPNHTEIPVNIKNILAGKTSDVPLLANDILFIPTSAAKSASLRALEAIIQASTGAAVYRPF